MFYKNKFLKSTIAVLTVIPFLCGNACSFIQLAPISENTEALILSELKNELGSEMDDATARNFKIINDVSESEPARIAAANNLINSEYTDIIVSVIKTLNNNERFNNHPRPADREVKLALETTLFELSKKAIKSNNTDIAIEALSRCLTSSRGPDSADELGLIMNPKSVDALITKGLYNGSRAIRTRSIMSLTKLIEFFVENKNYGPASQAYKAIIESKRTYQVHKINALRGLGEIGDYDSITYLENFLLTSQDDELCRNAAIVLGNKGNVSSIFPLCKLIEKKRYSSITAFRELIKIGDTLIKNDDINNARLAYSMAFVYSRDVIVSGAEDTAYKCLTQPHLSTNNILIQFYSSYSKNELYLQIYNEIRNSSVYSSFAASLRPSAKKILTFVKKQQAKQIEEMVKIITNKPESANSAWVKLIKMGDKFNEHGDKEGAIRAYFAALNSVNFTKGDIRLDEIYSNVNLPKPDAYEIATDRIIQAGGIPSEFLYELSAHKFLIGEKRYNALIESL